MQEAVKRAVARVGRGRFFPRRLPAHLGGCRFPASLEGGTKFLRLHADKFDPMLTTFAREFVTSGSVVWDVGANVGLFTFAAAGLAGPTGHVLAVEADTWLAGNLREAAQWNVRQGRVTVVPAAASSGFGLAEFQIARANRAVNHLTSAPGSGLTGGMRETQWVPTLPIDALLDDFAPPSVLKVDVEGAEPQVLRGAGRVLSHHPVALIEVNSQQAEEVADLLRSAGYRTFLDAVTREHVADLTANIIASR
jgi:FkbM family methyltransferase